MTKIGSVTAALLLAAAVLTLTPGCSSQPYEPTVSVPPGLTLEQIRRAIIQAGVDNDWQMQEVDDRTFRGLHDRYAQEAIILIEYSATGCTIRFSGHGGAGRPGSAGLSIGTYNDWVAQLSADISGRLQQELR